MGGREGRRKRNKTEFRKVFQIGDCGRRLEVQDLMHRGPGSLGITVDSRMSRPDEAEWLKPSGKIGGVRLSLGRRRGEGGEADSWSEKETRRSVSTGDAKT